MRRTLVWGLALLLLLVGCGRGEAPYAPEDAQALLAAGLFDGDMAAVDPYVAALLYGIDGETVMDCACYMATDTADSADELTVLILTDSEAAKAAEMACEERLATLLEDARRYAPTTVPRLEAAVIRRAGNTVLLAIGDPERLPMAVEGLHST